MNNLTQTSDSLEEPDFGSSAPSRQRFILVLLLFLHTVNTYMDRVCISSAKEDMQNDITGLGDVEMGYVFGIFAVGYALFQIPSGWFSDKVGPRRALTIVVIIWSIFTALTGFVTTAITLLAVRFLFGVGEAGAFPGATRAMYGWLPAKERGIAQGVFHSGARVGAGVSLILMPLLISAIGWRMTFLANALVGIVWGVVWWIWFRDEPQDHKKVNAAEVKLIQQGIEEECPVNETIPFIQIVTSANVLLAMFQYVAINITAFINLSWLQPYIAENYGEQYKWLASFPLFSGAIALWLSGYAVTAIHRAGYPVASRRVPAMLGYAMGAVGLLICTQFSGEQSVWLFIACYSLATFGVEMALSPSWAFCMDIGGKRSGAVSASMNMIGNLGAAVSAVLFPLFVSHVTIPFFAPTTGTANSFFVLAAVMNVLAIVCWALMNPKRRLKEISQSALKTRLILFSILMLIVIAVVVYVQLLK